MMPGGQRIGRRLRHRRNARAPVCLRQFRLHAASADSVRSQIAGAIASASSILDQSVVAHGGSQALQSVYSARGTLLCGVAGRGHAPGGSTAP